MPIYEYQCQDCGEEIEVLQKVSDPPAVNCPACGKPSLRKKLSAAAFRLKGGGWYETDFKTGNKKNLHGAAEGGSSGGGDKAADSGKSESAKGEGAKSDSKKSESAKGDSKKSDSKKSESTKSDSKKSESR